MFNAYSSLYYVAAALFVVSVIGIFAIWVPKEKIKISAFAVLIVTTIFLTFCQLGLPRPSWLFGVPPRALNFISIG